jgi:hypothetical protein
LEAENRIEASVVNQLLTSILGIPEKLPTGLKVSDFSCLGTLLLQQCPVLVGKVTSLVSNICGAVKEVQSAASTRVFVNYKFCMRKAISRHSSEHLTYRLTIVYVPFRNRQSVIFSRYRGFIILFGFGFFNQNVAINYFIRTRI